MSDLKCYGLPIFGNIDKELVKLEPSFSTFHDMSVLVVSWNCDSARPDSLYGEPRTFNFLHDALHSVEKPPDIITFGFQEVIDLENRKMAAKSILLGGKKKQDDGLSEKVTGAYKRWYDRLILAVKSAMPSEGYVVVHTENLIGLFSCIFVKSQLKERLKDVSISTIKRGMKGRYGNKVCSRFHHLGSLFNFDHHDRVPLSLVLFWETRLSASLIVIFLLARILSGGEMPTLLESSKAKFLSLWRNIHSHMWEEVTGP